MTDDMAILRREFDAGDGSFLLQLRCDLVWDREAFTRLTQAMLAACRLTEEETHLERWLAEGFWYVSWFVRQWSTHPNFPRAMEPAYYEAAYGRLEALVFWFFLGQPARPEGHQWTPIR